MRLIVLSFVVLVQTLCSAVVQVYGTDRSCSWLKRCCGVACLVKDNPQRSYFIRVFDIKVSETRWRVTWERWYPSCLFGKKIKLGETAGLPLFHKIHLPVMCLLFFPTRLLRWVINTQIWHWFWLPRPQQKANKPISQLILAWKTYPTWLNITTLHIKMYSTDTASKLISYGWKKTSSNIEKDCRRNIVVAQWKLEQNNQTWLNLQ